MLSSWALLACHGEQAPVEHPETGAAMTLERYKRTLLDPSCLEGPTAEVLGALSNVLVFHLLGRGDDSWSKRDAILERLRGLPPIRDPSTLFQSVLVAEDKERLREMVAALGREVRSHLGSGCGDRYAEAARLVRDLLELRVVEHGFVERLVVTEARCSMQHACSIYSRMCETST